MRIGLVQLTSSDDPAENSPAAQDLIAKAAAQGAQFVLTPEVTNCVSTSRSRQKEVLQTEADDSTLAALQAQVVDLGIWLLIGSLALKSDGDDPRFVNRSFLIAPEGEIAARYDKIHMFDVNLSEAETYRESDGYRPGDRAVLTDIAGMPLGMTICYDLRFPYLFRGLAKSGARIMAVPSAFSPETGPAHWEVLLRARLAKALPKGMELSHFSVLNHLARTNEEKTPAQLAKSFNVTRGAMTNTIGKLDWAGYVHIRPDWDDARRKQISISQAGRKARAEALDTIAPILADVVDTVGAEKVRSILPILREVRKRFDEPS